MSRPLVTVVGAGQVGATTAQRIGEAGLADVALIDIVEGLPQGKSLDLAEAAPILGADARFIGSNDFAAMRGSEVVVVTAGLARKPGMSREDLLQKNAAIVGGIADRVAEQAPEATVIVVSNPLDVMTWLTHRRTRFPKRRVMGMAGVLDSAQVQRLPRDGTRRLGQGHPRDGPRRTRRPDGAAAALHHPRRRAGD